MSKAKLDSTTTRRRFLAGAAAVAPAAGLAIIASGAVAQAIAAPDPVYAVIEAHKAATKALNDLLDEQAALEKTLSGDRRQSVITARETVVSPSDAPDWIANQHAVRAVCDRESEAALAILQTSPTTLAGVAAILGYAAAYAQAGNEWPWLDSFGRPWEAPFHEMLAGAVRTIASS